MEIFRTTIGSLRRGLNRGETVDLQARPQWPAKLLAVFVVDTNETELTIPIRELMY
jgi:hypothetical protein